MSPISQDHPASDEESVGKGYWLLVFGKPASVQAKKKQAKARLTKYKKLIRTEASQIFWSPIEGGVEVTIYHFHRGTVTDLDNIQKPILDGLTGIAYHDDNQVEGLTSKRINLNASATISGVTSPLIPKALSEKKECVVIGIKPVS